MKEILERLLYLGEAVWNRTKKRDRWGQRRASARSEDEWLRQSVPGLRIITDAAWRTARTRLDSVRTRLHLPADGSRGRRHARDVDSRHLLTGFARCAVCGASFYALSRSHGRERAFFYGCSAHHKRGHTVCGNNLVKRVDLIDDAILSTLGGEVLRPEVVMAVIDGVLAEFEPARAGRDAEPLKVELQQVERELANLSRAIATGGPLEPLLTELRARQRRRDEVQYRIAAREAVAVQRVDRRGIERTIRQHLDHWRSLLTKHTADGRRLLREVLVGPLRFTPEGRTYRFEGEVAIGRLLTGIVPVATALASPTGR